MRRGDLFKYLALIRLRHFVRNDKESVLQSSLVKE